MISISHWEERDGPGGRKWENRKEVVNGIGRLEKGGKSISEWLGDSDMSIK